MSDGEAKVVNGIPLSHKTNKFVILPDGKLGSTLERFISDDDIPVPLNLSNADVKQIYSTGGAFAAVLGDGG